MDNIKNGDYISKELNGELFKCEEDETLGSKYVMRYYNGKWGVVYISGIIGPFMPYPLFNDFVRSGKWVMLEESTGIEDGDYIMANNNGNNFNSLSYNNAEYIMRRIEGKWKPVYLDENIPNVNSQIIPLFDNLVEKGEWVRSLVQPNSGYNVHPVKDK